MKHPLFSILMLLAVSSFMASCGEKKTAPAADVEDSLSLADPDTTVYGFCGEGTTMHSLQLITDDGRIMTLTVDAGDDSESLPSVKGGLLAGDRMAAVISVVDGDSVASSVVNLNTLLGRWTSIDRNFEIVEGGDIISTVQSEKNPYTAWKIHNGRLLMGRDTFDILTLGADSLELECQRGIFVYKRQR